MAADRKLVAVKLPGQTPYADAWALQRAVHAEVSSGDRPDTLMLLEHPRTITMGRRGGWTHLSSRPQQLLEEGFELWHIDRGGDITYHGPGQLVGYPIVNLERAGLALGDYLRGMERAHITLLGEHGVQAERQHGYTGVWCGRQKITAIGVRVTSWTTMHGFAMNIATRLPDFEHIVPCGLAGRGVTSLSALLSRAIAPEAVAGRLAECLAAEWGYGLTWAQPESLPEPPPNLVRELELAHRQTAADLPDTAPTPGPKSIDEAPRHRAEG